MLDEYELQSIRNEIKRHKLTISLTKYKIEVLDLQLEFISNNRRNFIEYNLINL